MTVFPSSPSQTPLPWQDLSDPLWWDEPFPDQPDLSLEETELTAPATTAPRSGASKPTEDLVHQVASGCLEANPPPRPSSAVQPNDDSLSSIASPEMISVLSCTDVGAEGCVNVVNETAPPQDGAGLEEARALNKLGLTNFYGRDEMPQDYNQALGNFTTAANSGCAAAKCNLACCYLLMRKKNAAIKLLKEAAHDGFTPAMNYLAIRWLLGWDNGKKSFTDRYRYFKEAVTLLKEGVEQKDRMCMLNLASCYEFGIGVHRDQAECTRLRQNAEKLYPHKDSDNLIEEILYQLTEEEARGIKKASWLPRYEFRKSMVEKIPSGASVAESSLQLTFQLPPICEAVALGIRVGRNQFLIKLGAAYQSGIGGIKDSEKAVNSFLQAGGLGSLEQLYKLGMVCLTGIGCEQDPKLALIIFSAGADLGDPACRDMYQRCCAHGIGVTGIPQATLQSSLNVQTNADSPQTIPVLSCTLSEGSGQRKKRKVEKIPSSATLASDLEFIPCIFPLQPTRPLNQKRLLDAKRQPSLEHQSVPDPSSDYMELLIPEMSVSALEPGSAHDSLSHQDSSVTEGCAEHPERPLLKRLLKTPLTEKQVEIVLKEIEQQTNPSPPTVAILVEKARTGDAVACNDLGVWCSENEEGEQKIEHLFTLFASAAFKDIPAAQCNLGLCYYVYGKNCAAYRSIINSWLDKAAKAGYNEAWNTRGVISLFRSNLVRRWTRAWDRKEAKKSFKKGLDLGVRCSGFNLASCYEFGVGVEPNHDTAEEIRIKANELPPSAESTHLIKVNLYQFTEDDVIRVPLQEPTFEAKEISVPLKKRHKVSRSRDSCGFAEERNVSSLLCDSTKACVSPKKRRKKAHVTSSRDSSGSDEDWRPE